MGLPGSEIGIGIFHRPGPFSRGTIPPRYNISSIDFGKGIMVLGNWVIMGAELIHPDSARAFIPTLQSWNKIRL
jgi:hypothetical protein